MPFLIARCRPWAELESHLTDDLAQPGPQCGIGHPEFAFHPVELSLTADERLDEIDLFGGQPTQPTGLELPFDDGVTASAMKARDS